MLLSGKPERKQENSNVEASVKRILKIIDQAKENAGKERDNSYDVSVNIIFQRNGALRQKYS